MLFLYRVLVKDTKGNPLDNGVVRASDTNDLREILEEHFKTNGLLNEIRRKLSVRIYCLIDAQHGRLEQEDFFDMSIQLEYGPKG